MSWELETKVDGAMVPLRLDQKRIAFPVEDVGGQANAFINYLRFAALGYRAKARADIFEACALLKTCPTENRAAHAEALMRCLGQALGKQAKVLSPGAAEYTFDELWLMQIAAASARDDDASISFL